MQEGAVLEEVEIELKANGQDGRFIEEVFMATNTSACASHRARQWHRQYLHGMVDAPGQARVGAAGRSLWKGFPTRYPALCRVEPLALGRYACSPCRSMNYGRDRLLWCPSM